jgi:hypothetical protein
MDFSFDKPRESFLCSQCPAVNCVKSPQLLA